MPDNNFFRIILPWPNWKLSPNGTRNRNYRATLVAEARQSAVWLAREAMQAGNWVDNQERLFSIWIFRQPDKRNRDTGNMRGAMKAAQDGVFDALKIDDRAIFDEFLHRGDTKKNGEVELRLYESYIQWIDDVVVLSSSKYNDRELLIG